MSGPRFIPEDGPEDTNAYPGGVIPSGRNGSDCPYVHDIGPGNRAPVHIAEKLAELRLRCAVQGACRPRA